MTCVFCEIAAGSAPAYFVYRSQRVIAFLDIYPVEKGHTLVTPFEHYRDLLEVPDDLLSEIMRVVKAIAAAQLRSLGASGVRIVQNNGPAAGQVVFHVHFHVIPFYTHGVGGRRALKPDEGKAVSRILAEALQADATKGIS